MGLTFTIGGVSFRAMCSTPGRDAMPFDPPSEQRDEKRFHPPGVTGSYLVDGGRIGQDLSLRMRYRGSLADVYAMYGSDKRAWQGTTITIATPEGTYTRCRLKPGGMRIIRHPVARGDGTNVNMDAQADFISDA